MGDGHDPLPPSGEPEEPPVSWDKPVGPVAGAMNESMFIERLGRFVAEYWSLPLRNRRGEWEILNEQTASFPEYQSRLRELKAGLEVIWLGDMEERLQPVVRCVEKLFVLPRSLRNDRLPGLCQKEGLQVSEFRELADTLLGMCPEAEGVFAVLGFSWTANSRAMAAQRQESKQQEEYSEIRRKNDNYNCVIYVIILAAVAWSFICMVNVKHDPEKMTPSAKGSDNVRNEIMNPDSEFQKSMRKIYEARGKTSYRMSGGKLVPIAPEASPENDNPKKESK